MDYRYSQVDKGNLRWFTSDTSCATLLTVHLTVGHLRGLYPCRIDFHYPISAIAGENGCGKSTLLAASACAFHNWSNGYQPPERSRTYYTFKDFFVQTDGEVQPSGILLQYQILHNNWKRLPPGPAWQPRRKPYGGKWNNYDRRVPRNVVYFGINRVVPHSERSAHRTYRKQFAPHLVDPKIIARVADIAGKIFGRTYSKFSIHVHSKYRLPIVERTGLRYSGFNMGAGESGVFDILTSLLQAGKGILVVIDEIELGLHEKAQRRFVDELKTLCAELHCQIVCSTHSAAVLRALPPEARFFIETGDKTTHILQGISPEYACGKLSGANSREMAIFVEDGVGETIVNASLPLSLRERCAVIPIGSSQAVLRQLAARYREDMDHCIAFLDGDKSGEHASSMGKIKGYLETRYRDSDEEVTRWVNDRLHYLPGATWPERWLIKECIAAADVSVLESNWGCTSTQIRSSLGEALRAGKHQEFHTLASELHGDEDTVRTDIVRFVRSACGSLLQPVCDVVRTSLD